MGRVFIESFTPHEHRISVSSEGLGERKFALPKNFYSEDEQLKGKYRIIEVTEKELELLKTSPVFMSLVEHKKFRILTNTVPMKFQDAKVETNRLEKDFEDAKAKLKKELEDTKAKFKKEFITKEKYTELRKENEEYKATIESLRTTVEQMSKTEEELRNEITSLKEVIVELKKVQ